MTPILNILPRCTIEVRMLSGNELLPDERNWLLCSRDDRARPMWEVELSTTMLHTLLESLAEGKASVSTGSWNVQIYPDAELEEAILNWANQQLARYASGFDLPSYAYGGRADSASMHLV